MINIVKSQFAKRCVLGISVLSIGVWSLAVLIESSQNARAQSVVRERSETDVQYHFSQIPIGHAEELFGRGR